MSEDDAWAALRRYGQRPWRLRSKTRLEDAVILGVRTVEVSALDPAAIALIALVQVDDQTFAHGSLVPQSRPGLELIE